MFFGLTGMELIAMFFAVIGFCFVLCSLLVLLWMAWALYLQRKDQERDRAAVIASLDPEQRAEKLAQLIADGAEYIKVLEKLRDSDTERGEKSPTQG